MFQYSGYWTVISTLTRKINKDIINNSKLVKSTCTRFGQGEINHPCLWPDLILKITVDYKGKISQAETSPRWLVTSCRKKLIEEYVCTVCSGLLCQLRNRLFATSCLNVTYVNKWGTDWVKNTLQFCSFHVATDLVPVALLRPYKILSFSKYDGSVTNDVSL